MDDSALARYFGKPGEKVPSVDPADLKAVWRVYEDIRGAILLHEPEEPFVGLVLLRRVCSSQADTPAVIYRCWQLQMLDFIPGDLLASLKHNGRLPEAAFKIAARMPLEWMDIGQPRNGPPFDLEAFIEEVRKQSEGV